MRPSSSRRVDTAWVDHERSVEAGMATGFGQVALVTETFNAPIDRISTGRQHHLQLAVSPAPPNAVGCFPDSWGAHRFEPIGELFMAQ